MDHLYYRKNNRRKKASYRNKKDKKNLSIYLFPFVGVVLFVVISNLFSFISSKFNDVTGPDLSNSFTVDSSFGNVQYKYNDITDTLSSDVFLLEATEVFVPKDSALVLKSNNGSVLRFDESSNFIYKSFSDENGDIYSLKIKSGRVWMNTEATNDKFVFESDYVDFETENSIVSYKSNLPEVLNVFSGQGLVILKDVENNSELDKFMFESSTSMNLSNQQYQMFLDNKIGSIKTKTQSDVYLSNWYKWNTFYDNNQVNYTFEDLFVDESRLSLASIEDQITDNNSVSIVDEVSSIDKSTTPYFTFPENDQVISDERIKMLGSVPENIVKIVITSFENEKPEPYVLKEFEANSDNFVYYAFFDTERGNLVPGLNKFEVKGIKSDGSETPSSFVEFVFRDSSKPIDTKDVSLEKVDDISNDEIDQSINESTNTNGYDPILIKSINDLPFTNEFILRESRAFIVGEVPEDVTKVRINDFDLTMFEKGSRTFHYILSDGFKNLKIGENVLKIQYEKNGKFSPKFTLKINYDPS